MLMVANEEWLTPRQMVGDDGVMEGRATRRSWRGSIARVGPRGR